MKAKAYLGRLAGHSLDDYLGLIRQGLDFAGFGANLPREPRVFVKPNLTFATYQPGVMTSPTTLEAALIAIRERTPFV